MLYNLELRSRSLLQDGFLCTDRACSSILLLNLRFHVVHGADEDYLQPIITLFYKKIPSCDNDLLCYIHLDLIRHILLRDGICLQ
jgi:hypothetical protein